MLNRFYFSLHFQVFRNDFTEIISRLSHMTPLNHDKQNGKKKKSGNVLLCFCLPTT